MNCVLKSDCENFPDIILEDGVTIYLGRSVVTRIKDLKCSKKHLAVTADFKESIVYLRHTGSNPSVARDELLKKGESLKLRNGDNINLLKGLYKYTVFFTEKRDSTGSLKRELFPKNVTNAVKKKRDDKLSSDSEDDEIKAVQENLVKMQKTLTTFFKPSLAPPVTASIKSKISSEKSTWKEAIPGKLYIFSVGAPCGSSKIACFDIDGTIICTKSGKIFPSSISDWKLLYPQIPKQIQQLSSNGYSIIFFTNQKGISRGNLMPEDFQKKLQDITKELSVPFQALISSGSGAYRKPITGMWEHFKEHCNGDVEINLSESFYVGDAAGRPANWEPKRKKDFSCSDRLFALNCGLRFLTPEEYFLKQKVAPFTLPEFDPRKFCGPLAMCLKPKEQALSENEICQPPEVIVFVGFPAAGKSFFAKKYLVPQGYTHVNRDTLGSYQKCQALCDGALSNKGSVVIDNTNPDQESRKRFVDLAKKHNVTCRCFLFHCNIHHANHNNTFRELTSKDHTSVNMMILNSYKSKYKEPNIAEGFKEVVLINFVPKFESEKDEKLYKMFLT